VPANLQTKVRRLGILTGGGDVPGLNAAIKSVVYRAEPQGIEVLGIRSGWEGITFVDTSAPFQELLYDSRDPQSWRRYIWPLSRANTRTIDRTGGTILGSTRTNPAKVKVGDLPEHLKSRSEGKSPDDRVDLTDVVLNNLSNLGIDGLVSIGGDDTLSYGAVLAARGFPVWGIPKTMDNDVPGTDYCIGFQTAISRASEFITRMRSTAASHGETVLFRMFGRDAGFTALETAIVTWADRLIIPEVPCDIDKLAQFVRSDRDNPRGYSLVVMSEGANLGNAAVPEFGAADAYGHRAKTNVAEFLAGELSQRIPKVRFLPVDLTYILRSGEPDEYDRHAAIFYGNLAMRLLEQGIHGAMVAHRNGRYCYTDMPSKAHPARRVDPSAYNEHRYRPNFEGISGDYVPID
jgi:ATP-dependent phosphofructokinase / diphosphate-dependent phosphofructokinase